MPHRGKDCPNCGQHFEKERDFTPLDPRIITTQDFEELREGLGRRAEPDLTPLTEGIKEIQAKLSGPVSPAPVAPAPVSHALHASVEDLLDCPTCKPLVREIVEAQPAHLPFLDEIEGIVKDCPGCKEKWNAISTHVTTEARKGFVPEGALKGMVSQEVVREVIAKAAQTRSK